MCGNRPCGEQFSGVSRKQNEILKCNLLPSEECQVVGGQLPLEAAPPKEKAPFRVLFLLVEAGGIEPPSENTSTQVSPSAVCLLGFPSRTAGKQAMRYGIL